MNEHDKFDPKLNKTRRNLVMATSVVGGAAAVGAAVPFVVSLWPSERARAAGAPVEVDISKLAPGELGILMFQLFQPIKDLLQLRIGESQFPCRRACRRDGRQASHDRPANQALPPAQLDRPDSMAPSEHARNPFRQA